MDIVEVSSDYKDFKYLTNLFVKELKNKYNIISSDYINFTKPEYMEKILVGYLDGEPVACGGYAIYDDNTIEIRNLFILDECRNRGYSNHILQSLETKSVELGYISLITVLCNKQQRAIDFYLRNGFEIIKNNKEDTEINNCIYMKKKI